MNFAVVKVKTDVAKAFVLEHHYRRNMPKLTKVCYGLFIQSEMMGVITLGWGTRPKNTIKKIFPKLSTPDYFEIGRLCLMDELPRNSESEFIARVARLVKREYPNVKVLFSFSDGIMGKPGFVYQASNFLYSGFIWTDIYLTKEGYLMHPRSVKSLLEINAKQTGKKMFWLSDEFMRLNGIKRIKGKQFRYVLPICKRSEIKRLIETAVSPLTKEYPKMKDIEWKVKTPDGYRKLETMKPVRTLNAFEVSRAIRLLSKEEGLVRFQPDAINKTLNEY